MFDGEGTPTYKWDGCNVRVEMHEGRVRTILGRDKKSQLPAAATNIIGRHLGGGLNGWYYAELVGPGINGNRHMRVAHSLVLFDHFLHLVPTCETPIATVVKACPSPCDEGVVWHHPDGRRAKLRAPDLKRAGIWPTELSGDS